MTKHNITSGKRAVPYPLTHIEQPSGGGAGLAFVAAVIFVFAVGTVLVLQWVF